MEKLFIYRMERQINSKSYFSNIANLKILSIHKLFCTVINLNNVGFCLYKKLEGEPENSLDCLIGKELLQKNYMKELGRKILRRTPQYP
jgi:hypothetical protein